MLNKVTGIEWGINGIYQDRLVITSYEDLKMDSTVHIFPNGTTDVRYLIGHNISPEDIDIFKKYVEIAKKECTQDKPEFVDCKKEFSKLEEEISEVVDKLKKTSNKMK